MDAERNRRNLRKVRGLVKYGTAVLTMMGAAHCALLCGGFDHVYIHLLWCVFALMLGVYLNRLFGFCRTHLVCVGYITLMLVLMSVEQRMDVQGSLYHLCDIPYCSSSDILRKATKEKREELTSLFIFTISAISVTKTTLCKHSDYWTIHYLFR